MVRKISYKRADKFKINKEIANKEQLENYFKDWTEAIKGINPLDQSTVTYSEHDSGGMRQYESVISKQDENSAVHMYSK